MIAVALPTLETLETGDTFAPSRIHSVPGYRFMYIVRVLSVELKERFNKPDALVRYELTCISESHEPRVIDSAKLGWFSQIMKGLV